MTFALFGLGLGWLILGADLLVRGSSRLAARLGISPLLVGLTVVAYGTSAPEIAVSVAASRGGQPDIALGNVVGSNICNVLLILGLAALATPLTVARRLIRLEVPLMIGVSFLILGIASSGEVQRWIAALLLAGGIAYTLFLLQQGRREEAAARAEENRMAGTGPGGRPRSSWIWPVAWSVVGLVLLVVGSRLLVSATVELARVYEISELVIGLTLVSVGTSLPELATCVVAGLRGEREMAVGNVVGSNLFNLLIVLGAAGVASSGPIPIPETLLRFDLPVMTAAALACLPVFFTGRVICRLEGAMFLIYYAAYMVFLLLAAHEHAALPLYGKAMLWFVVPLTALGLLASVLRPHAGEACQPGPGPSG